MDYRKVTLIVILSLLTSVIYSSNTNAISFNIKNPLADISLTKENKLKKQIEAKKKRYNNIKNSIDKKVSTIDNHIKKSEVFKAELENLNNKIEELTDKVEEKRNNAAAIAAAPIREVVAETVATIDINKVSPTESGNMYAPGNCTWYVKSRRHDIGSFWGNANQWISSAVSEGYKTGSIPQVGAIGVNFDGYFGHVVYVEGVSGDKVSISEMNYNGLGVISSRITNSSEFQYIYSL